MESCPHVHECATGGGPKICNGMCIGESTMKVKVRKKIIKNYVPTREEMREGYTKIYSLMEFAKEHGRGVRHRSILKVMTFLRGQFE